MGMYWVTYKFSNSYQITGTVEAPNEDEAFEYATSYLQNALSVFQPGRLSISLIAGLENHYGHVHAPITYSDSDSAHDSEEHFPTFRAEMAVAGYEYGVPDESCWRDATLLNDTHCVCGGKLNFYPMTRKQRDKYGVFRGSYRMFFVCEQCQHYIEY